MTRSRAADMLVGAGAATIATPLAIDSIHLLWREPYLAAALLVFTTAAVIWRLR